MNIIFSMGDCNGIGLEIFAKAVAEFDKIYENAYNYNLHIAGNIQTISEYYDLIDLPVYIDDEQLVIGSRKCKIIPCDKYVKIQFGQETKNAGLLAAEAIELSINKTLSEDYDAFITLPVSKAALYLGGWQLPGHTEMLADKCNSPNPLMILCSKDVRVTLATIHEAIANVPELLKTDSLKQIITLFAKSLEKDFGAANPKIAVLGLNPHSGESGSMGREEIDIISPAIKITQKDGINAEGPFPADGFFAHGEYKNFDGILAMYHDQGLIPLKLLAKGAGVNFTGNLPIVRTSPDHGTAFGLAGKGLADYRSTLEAIMMAIEISKNRNK